MEITIKENKMDIYFMIPIIWLAIFALARTIK